LNTGREEGFCYYNTIAIAARYAQKQYGFKKILIIDWDYHHGNATEAMFYDDPSVLYFSTHDQFAYPGTGDPAKKGIGKGLGFNINVHLPCGTDDKKIIDVYKSILLPAAEKFEPDMILISAGFDSREEDLLGCFDITDAAYVTMTKIVMKIAEKHCDGRVVSMLEGGYNLQGIAKAVTVHIKTLLGEV
jgi:acetoin utilization deacetylase AcuC-like enzyme